MCYAQALPSAVQVVCMLLHPVQSGNIWKIISVELAFFHLIIDFSGQIMTQTSEK